MAKLTEYASLEEKAQSYGNCHKVVKTASELQDELGGLFKKNALLFRGVNQAKYKLFTSGQREYIQNEYAKVGVFFDNFMQSLLHNVDADADLKEYNTVAKIKTNASYYFTYLQHYGACSPYIDFSTNLRVALFFSTFQMQQLPSSVDIDNYYSLYYVAKKDIPFIRDRYKKLLAEATATNNVRKIELNMNALIEMQLFYVSWQHHSGLFGNHRYLYRMPNRNMLAQKGALIFNASDSTPLEELDILKGKIHCIDIHKSLWQKMQTMYLQGIIEEKLFPCEYRVAKQAYTDFKQTLQ